MIDYETFCRLRQLHDEGGLKVSQIAAELHLDPKTVERWIDQPTYRQRQSARRPSKLDSFRGQIVVSGSRGAGPTVDRTAWLNRLSAWRGGASS